MIYFVKGHIEGFNCINAEMNFCDIISLFE